MPGRHEAPVATHNQLGPVPTIGAGGIRVEVLRDVTHRVLPVDPLFVYEDRAVPVDARVVLSD